MAKVQATVVLYRNDSEYDYTDILTQEDYEELIKTRAKEMYEDPEEFLQYLEDNYTLLEIFNLTEQDKKVIKKDDFKYHCETWARDEFSEQYSRIELETEVLTSAPVPCNRRKNAERMVRGKIKSSMPLSPVLHT